MTQSLAPYHTFHLPASAANILEFHTVEQLLQAYQTAKPPVLVIGQGSNLLFLEDFSGTVLRNQLKGITHHQDEQFHYLRVAGGEIWHELVQWALAHQIYGLENLALIPGCVGSAPIQNIGAYGVEFEQLCDFVNVLNLQTGERFALSREDCQFGYRESIFKHQYREHFVIVEVGLKLAKNWSPVLSYGSLAQLDPSKVTAEQIFEEVCAVRRAKLPDPNILGNAGSFFKNPVVSADLFQQILTAYPAMPHYPQADGTVKLPAGWLIDQCQLKGVKIGGAAVHQQQALVLINAAQATGKEVLALARLVRQKVREKFAVELHPEVRFIGENGEVDSEALTR